MPSTRHAERHLADILAIRDQHVERIKLHLVIVPAAVQPVEIGSAVDTEQHGLAVDHKRGLTIAERRLPDQRKAVAPIVPVARP